MDKNKKLKDEQVEQVSGGILCEGVDLQSDPLKIALEGTFKINDDEFGKPYDEHPIYDVIH